MRTRRGVVGVACLSFVTSLLACAARDDEPANGPPPSPAASSEESPVAAAPPAAEGGLPPAADGFLTAALPVGVPVVLSSVDVGPLRDQLESAFAQSASELAATHEVPHLAVASYDPLTAGGLQQIAASPVSLDASELTTLAERGFVISRRLEYPSMAYGYASIFGADLPVFISADMLLEAVHRSYDSMLALLEAVVLVPDLTRLVDSMRGRLADGAVPLAAGVAEDTDVYLTIAASLLGDSEQAPHDPALTARVHELYRAIRAAGGEASIELFGAQRLIDASQFEPRGHYADDPALQGYFRAMTWFGRTDFRLIETQSDGTTLFRPRQLQAAFALDALMDDAARAMWREIDQSVGLFVGEHDDMTPAELGDLLAALGVERAADLSALPDARIAEALTSGHFGEQRIASRIIVRQAGDGTFPLDASFAFFGQRYTVDAHVFSNVVYDRAGRGSVKRVMPKPLDVAFAALGNDQAVSLLAPELASYAYAGDLAAVRVLVDAHPDAYWQSSLYTSWLAALRSLSPRVGGTSLDEPGLPEVARTEAWGRRLLGTQLASWAELRHDTVLYAKQSYTASGLCEFPDAYVDPYPAFFHAIERFAELGRERILAMLANIVPTDPDRMQPSAVSALSYYFQNLADVSARLAEMAEYQRTGQPHTPEQLDFINDAVQVETTCGGGERLTGWYPGLFFALDSMEESPIIADVHTDPGGIDPPRDPSVLHVGTGLPRLMVMTRETCAGPRAYVGMVSSYYEQVTPGLERLTDEVWKGELTSGAAPASAAWLDETPPAAP